MSDPVVQTITVAPIEPATPVVVCDSKFLSTLAHIEREVAHLAVNDGQSAQLAADLTQRLTKAGRMLEDARQKLKAPFLAKGREIDEAAKAPAGRIEAAKKVVQGRLIEFDLAQRRAAEETERKRQEEVRALEEKVKRENEERAKAAAQVAAKATPASSAIDLDDLDIPDDLPLQKTEAEQALEAAKYAPAPAPVKPVGVAFRATLRIASIDVNKLPDMFVVRTANEKALRATFCTGYKDGDPLPTCDGVVFAVDRVPISTGKADF